MTQKRLEGTWHNQLGSSMKIGPVAKDGTITGTYTTAVSKEGCAKGDFRLVGRITPSSGDKGAVVAFVVAWKNADESDCHSVTAWSGLYEVIDDQERITAFWLHTSGASSTKSWNSTIIGEDTFARSKSTVADLTKRPSHP
jgi:hypothetical protein